MSLLFREYRRLTLIPLAALGIAAYCLFIYLPLERRARALDVPLQKDWRLLAAALGRSNATRIDFLRITNQLSETRQALSLVETARQRAAERLKMPPDIRERLSEPFQLFEYENQRSRDVEALRQLAQQHKVAVDPSVFTSFPEHTADVTQPELLWASLPLIKALLTSAFNAKVAAVHSLEVPVALTNQPAASALLVLEQIPIQIELTGLSSNVVALLESLPLRSSELKAAGLPESTPEKPPLFIDRLMIKKQSVDRPEEIRVWMRVLGFVLRE